MFKGTCLRCLDVKHSRRRMRMKEIDVVNAEKRPSGEMIPL